MKGNIHYILKTKPELDEILEKHRDTQLVQEKPEQSSKETATVNIRP